MTLLDWVSIIVGGVFGGVVARYLYFKYYDSKKKDK